MEAPSGIITEPGLTKSVLPSAVYCRGARRTSTASAMPSPQLTTWQYQETTTKCATLALLHHRVSSFESTPRLQTDPSSQRILQADHLIQTQVC